MLLLKMYVLSDVFFSTSQLPSLWKFRPFRWKLPVFFFVVQDRWSAGRFFAWKIHPHWHRIMASWRFKDQDVRNDWHGIYHVFFVYDTPCYHQDINCLDLQFITKKKGKHETNILQMYKPLFHRITYIYIEHLYIHTWTFPCLHTFLSNHSPQKKNMFVMWAVIKNNVVFCIEGIILPRDL